MLVYAVSHAQPHGQVSQIALRVSLSPSVLKAKVQVISHLVVLRDKFEQGGTHY